MEITYEDIASLGVFAEFQRLSRRLFGLTLALASPDMTKTRVFGPRSEMNPFCVLLDSTSEGSRRCHHCDRQRILSAVAGKIPLQYECHAGLSEFVIPIVVEQRVAAVLQCGQVLNHPPTPAGWRRTARGLAGWKGNIAVARQLWFQTRVLRPEDQDDAIALLRLFAENVVAAYSRLRLLDEGKQSRTVHRAQSYINAQFGGPLLLPSIARAAGTSSRNLTRLFRDESGKTVLEFIHETRVRQACEKLALTRREVKEIAPECGFGTVQQFNRLFRKYRKCTPLEWRRHAATPEQSAYYVKREEVKKPAKRKVASAAQKKKTGRQP